jgi:DNA mismatch repair protein MutS
MSETTPLMDQYLAIKAKYKDTILLYRMGDFYETFYDDAKIASKVLGIVLTSRAHGKASDVPLAGFPHHALEGYLTKLIKAGYKVAVCEQLEDPKFAKGVVKRDVVEIVTPGTATSDKILESKKNNYLASIYINANTVGMGLTDVSTGEFFVSEFDLIHLIEQVEAFNPSEILVSNSQFTNISEKFKNKPFIFTKIEDWIFNYDYAYEILLNHFKTHSLKGFGIEGLNSGIISAGSALSYLKEMQKNELIHISKISKLEHSDYITLDNSTKRNLEIITSIAEGGKEGTLIQILDNTKTPMGGRLLKKWIQHPLKNLDRITSRLEAVDELYKSKVLRSKLSDELEKISDLERLIGKISTARANARDLIALKKTLSVIPNLKELLQDVKSKKLQRLNQRLSALDEIVKKIDLAIVDDPPVIISEGGIIKKGYNKELDDLREIAFHGKDWIAKLQETERQRTGISSLKINYNKVFGYYIEITKANFDKVPDNYIRKQTLVNSERFITPDLKEYEEKVLNAEERINDLEYELFNKLRIEISKHSSLIQQNAEAISQIDCLLSFAEVSIQRNYIKPTLTEEDGIIIEDGRHPVVEVFLPPGESFIANDLRINNSTDQILIITGPNMSGKSTILRQVGLIVLMAQIGSFVPAKRAYIGLVDKIFTRVGASDNITSGESTFLVEMNEMANILNNATPKSLILLDEIGRGTSTFDGISIAWAIVEFLHNNPGVCAKTIFATHYHELTELELILPRVRNYNVAVKEVGDKVIFLRKLVQGGTDHSYGIQVAKMAGIPNEVIERAKEVLFNLEANELTPNATPKLAIHSRSQKNVYINQISLFEEDSKALKEKIRKIEIEKMSPLEALNILNELKKVVE